MFDILYQLFCIRSEGEEVGEQLIADIFGASDEEEEFEARTVLNLFLNKCFVFIQTLIYSSLKMISTLNPRT